jgi:hypothetical protein
MLLTSCFSLPIFNVLFLLAYIKPPVSPWRFKIGKEKQELRRFDIGKEKQEV